MSNGDIALIIFSIIGLIISYSVLCSMPRDFLKAFEESCIKNKVGSDESECKVPCICGYYGRACRQMNDKADRFLCTGCALAEFSK